MKNALKIAGILLLVVIVLIGAILIYVKNALPDVGPAEDLTIELTSERIERGRYLAWSVSVCMDCHSMRDWTKFSGPIMPGTTGKGGERFDQSVGLPGVFYSKNITPQGIKRYTDGELVRVITTGVSKEGKAMFPIMPYPYYGRMDKEDIYSIIAYLRTLEPIQNEVPESIPDFPMNFIINTIPRHANPQPRPDPSDQLATGAYIINAAGCVECHSPFEKGKIVEELSYSGGREFLFPDGSVVRSANITQDKETGIGNWTREQFIRRFKSFSDSSYSLPVMRPGEFNTIMPWTMYSRMDEADLSAMFVYLQTVDPIANGIKIFDSPEGN